MLNILNYRLWNIQILCLKDLGKEKWEIFDEVEREIYCEIEGFQKSDITLKDSKIIRFLKTGKYIEEN